MNRVYTAGRFDAWRSSSILIAGRHPQNRRRRPVVEGGASSALNRCFHVVIAEWLPGGSYPRAGVWASVAGSRRGCLRAAFERGNGVVSSATSVKLPAGGPAQQPVGAFIRGGGCGPDTARSRHQRKTGTAATLSDRLPGRCRACPIQAPPHERREMKGKPAVRLSVPQDHRGPRASWHRPATTPTQPPGGDVPPSAVREQGPDIQGPTQNDE
jgi:hypothetical protein